MRRIVIIALLIAVFLCGCWDYKDVNKTTLVLTIGLDIEGEEYMLSGEYALMNGGQSKSGGESEGGGSGGGPKVTTFKSKGKNFEEARHGFKDQITDPIFLGATSLIIFGTEYAKQGIVPYLNRIDKLPDYKKTALVVISRENPSVLFEAGTEKSSSVGFLIENNVNLHKKRKSGFYSDVGQILSDVDMGLTGYLLPYFGLEEGEIKSLGFAAMKDSKFVGAILADDSHGIIYLMVKGAKMNEIIQVPGYEGEEGKVNFENNIKSKKIDFEYKDGQLTINIEFENKAELDHQYDKQIIDEQKIKELEGILSDVVVREVSEVITRSQIEFKADLFDFAKHFRAKHYKEYQNMDWEQTYINAKVNIIAKTEICCLALTDTEAKRRR